MSQVIFEDPSVICSGTGLPRNVPDVWRLRLLDGIGGAAADPEAAAFGARGELAAVERRAAIEDGARLGEDDAEEEAAEIVEGLRHRGDDRGGVRAAEVER